MYEGFVGLLVSTELRPIQENEKRNLIHKTPGMQGFAISISAFF